MARKSFKGSHVELRHNTYFAILVVPKDVRQQIGKSKFFKTTGTGDRKLAETRASAMILGWKTEINAARSQSDDPILKSALELLALLQDKRTSHLVKDAIDDETSRLRQESGDLVADTFKNIATGESKPLSTYIDSWIEHQTQRGLAQKTIDQMTSDVKLMTKTIQAPNLLTELHVKAWIGLITKDNKLTASSITRLMGSSTNFFKFLKFVGAIHKNAPNPFIVPDAYRISKKSNSKSINKTTPWAPLTEAELIELYDAALTANDRSLADLIMVGAYTGARIEEICSLKCSEINLQENTFSIVDAKTDAGRRTIPIHTKIRDRISQMVTQSTDGFLVAGLTENKYKNRSNAIGKRFGRLKKELGYSDQHVFHSIRKTFTTCLENAGVSENLAADIVGHEKPRITYGLYSGGATIPVMREAIEKVHYGFKNDFVADQEL